MALNQISFEPTIKTKDYLDSLQRGLKTRFINKCIEKVINNKEMCDEILKEMISTRPNMIDDAIKQINERIEREEVKQNIVKSDDRAMIDVSKVKFQF